MLVCDRFCVLSGIMLVCCPLCWVVSQDAHELFHVLTSSLEEERERLPKVPHFFDMRSLEVRCGAFESTEKAIQCFFSLLLSSELFTRSVLFQTPPVQEQTVACISRGKHCQKVLGFSVSSKSNVFHLC